MADHLTEEEQIEALKRWWNEYWKSVVVPIVAIALGYYGYNIWSAQQEEKRESGGMVYAELVTSMESGELSDDQINVAKSYANELVSEYAGTLYADHGNMVLARFAVEAKDLDGAAAYLQAVVDKGANDAIKDLAKARLARVKVSQKDYSAALALVTTPSDDSYKSLFAEVRGDALAAQGQTEAAKTAFQEAIDSLPIEQFSRRSIIQIKLDGVAILANSQSVAVQETETEVPAEAQAEEKTEEPISSQAPETSAENS